MLQYIILDTCISSTAQFTLKITDIIGRHIPEEEEFSLHVLKTLSSVVFLVSRKNCI